MLINADQQQIVDAVRDFAQARLKPFAAQRDRGHCLPADAMGEEGAGYRIALSNLEGERIGIAAQSIGMALGENTVVDSLAAYVLYARLAQSVDHRARQVLQRS